MKKEDGSNVSILKIIGIFSTNDEMSEERKTFKLLAKRYALYLDIQFFMVIERCFNVFKIVLVNVQ